MLIISFVITENIQNTRFMAAAAVVGARRSSQIIAKKNIELNEINWY